MEWIKVDKDNLPTEEILACGYQKEMIIGYLDADRDGIICQNEGQYLSDVTHWMPLPEPPKE